MKKILKTLIFSLLVLEMTGCDPKKNSGLIKQNNTSLDLQKIDMKDDNAFLFSITSKKTCIPVSLSIYENGKYILYTAYETCLPGRICPSMLKYTKPKIGIYDYDVSKIIDASINADDVTPSIDNLNEYEIYTKNGKRYVVPNGKTNIYLDELLNQINVDLNVCAEKDYLFNCASINVEEKINKIVSNGPKNSSNPFDYIRENKEIYDELLDYPTETFMYAIKDLIETNGNDGLKSYIEAILCSKINKNFKDDFISGSDYLEKYKVFLFKSYSVFNGYDEYAKSLF